MPKAAQSKTTKTSKVTAKTVSKPKKETSKPKKTSVANLENTVAASTPFSGKMKMPNFDAENIKAKIKQHQNPRTYVILIIVGLAFLAFVFRSWFIAATVNGSPISNFEVISQMNKQFREQTITQLVNEKLILAEARKQGVKVTPSEIEAKLAEIEANVGGAEVLDTLLSQQGQTRDSIKQQMQLQITIEKLYGNEATVSAQEVTAFIEQNKDQLRATESAAQMTEAEEIIKQQKLSQIFNEKFTQLKENAKITIF